MPTPIGIADEPKLVIPAELPPESIIFGRSKPMEEVRNKILKISNNSIPVLIHGESGTGKEVIASLLHNNSPNSSGAFMKVNCPAIPGTLLESELFGYEKGAFTGANGTKPGRVELADRGTLFLDEISEMDASLQSKLLQFLQDGQFCRIGGQENRQIEVRIICATNRNLEAQVEAGNFRQDLFYRINVIGVRLPSLRERAADIPDLASYFIEVFNEKYNCRAKPLSAGTLRMLSGYSWPGNIRQLENFIKRYVILGTEESICGELMPTEPRSLLADFKVEHGMPLKKITRDAVRDIERQVILKSLQASNWNRKRAARMLSISYRALLYKLKDAGFMQLRTAVEPPASTKGD